MDFSNEGVVSTVLAVQFSASDGTTIDTETVNITVQETNESLSFTSTPTALVDLGQVYNYDIIVSDTDAPAQTIVITPVVALPSWLKLVDNSGGTGRAVLIGAPTFDDVGSIFISLSASDGVDTVTQSFTFTVFTSTLPSPKKVTESGSGLGCSLQSRGNPTPSVALVAFLLLALLRRRRRSAFACEFLYSSKTYRK